MERINNIKDNLMHQTSLYFKIKDSAALEKHTLLEIFFKLWVDESCNNEVSYNIEPIHDPNPCRQLFEETFRVDFDKMEDAVALKLKGIPSEFQGYIELVV